MSRETPNKDQRERRWADRWKVYENPSERGTLHDATRVERSRWAVENADRIFEVVPASLLKEERERVEELERALLPLAALAPDVDMLRHRDSSTCLHRLKAGDIRKAAAAALHREGG